MLKLVSFHIQAHLNAFLQILEYFSQICLGPLAIESPCICNCLRVVIICIECFMWLVLRIVPDREMVCDIRHVSWWQLGRCCRVFEGIPCGSYSIVASSKVRGKGKAVPLQARRGSEGSRKLRFPDFLTTAQDGGRLSALRTGRLYPQGNTPGTHFC